MDMRLQGILKSLLVNIDVLDNQLLSLLRSEQFHADTDCVYLIDRIRECCGSTLQCVGRLGRVARGNAFVIPPDVMASMD